MHPIVHVFSLPYIFVTVFTSKQLESVGGSVGSSEESGVSVGSSVTSVVSVVPSVPGLVSMEYRKIFYRFT